jgi:hypothetical protein
MFDTSVAEQYIYRMPKQLCSLGVATAHLLLCAVLSSAADRLSVIGKVSDTRGRPIEHATVLVYSAGVKKGYSRYCPTCYTDCGKHAITDGKGTFTITGLNPDLWFRLLVALDGYEPVFVSKVDPSLETPVAVTLVRRNVESDSSRLFRGLIQDSHGLPVRDAIVKPAGILLDDKTRDSMYGTIEGLEPVAVSNKNGEFEIAYSKPGLKILALVEARAMAPIFAVIPAGTERKLITLMDGAVVRGRLVQNGKPVGNAEIGLIGRPHGGYRGDLQVTGYPYEEIRIGTQPDGRFAITNVPVPADWYVYGKMESLVKRGATGVVECSSKRDTEIIDVGDIQIKAAHALRGNVVLSDGKPIPEGMRVTISSERAWDSQTAILPPDGHFEFDGLAAGDYSLFASVKGYSLPKKPISVTVKKPDGTSGTVTYMSGALAPLSLDRDIEGYIIKMDPEK